MVLLIILGSLVVTIGLSAVTRIHPAAFGCLLPILAAPTYFILMLTMSFGNSTAGLGVFVVPVYVAMGAVPGAFIGGWIQTLLGRPPDP